ncbi:MAG: GntR family transcriptional regulator [Eubacterium sp.]|nr:GntR family transcriptional regulator [Eubacterium sp.]
MPWKFENGSPIYKQLVHRIKTMIAAGTYSADEKMPSVREMAVITGVNPNTMQRAFAELEQEGLLYSRRTSGRFVTGEEKILKDLRERLAYEEISRLFDELEKLGMSDDEIRQSVAKWREEPDGND